MDSKVLYISLLLAVFCLWYTEASPGEEKYDEKYELEDYRKESPGSRAAINDYTARVAGHSALAYANKAKAIESKCKLMLQVYRDREYYMKEYEKIAEICKKKSAEFGQLAMAESARVSGHVQREKEWSSKSREAATSCRDEEVKAQQMRGKADEYRREAILAYVRAVIHQAEASGYNMKADRALELAKDNERKAENMRNDAIRLYQRGKEALNKATAEKVKAHQQAENSQRHHVAAASYRQEAIKSRMASTTYLMKYIHDSLLAERTANIAEEEKLKADCQKREATENAKHSEENAAISKITHNEYLFSRENSRRSQNKGYEYDESKRMMGSAVTDTGALLSMAQTKDEASEDEGDYKLPVFPADDPVKAMPSEDKQPFLSADEGMS